MNKSRLTLIAAAATSLSVAMAEQRRPNILFILTDDQDAATLDVYGDSECDTPNIDRLAKQGVAFTGAYQMGSFVGAVSTASRTMIMTGRNVWSAMALRENMTKYPKRFGNVDNVDPSKPEYNSLPAIFHRAGYETYRTCKNGNSYEAANSLFDQRFDKVCRADNDESGSRWHADNVIKYLNERSADSDPDKKPFFIYLGFSHPHDPRNGKPELLEKYGSVNIAEPTEINDKMPALPINYLPEKPFHDGHPNLRDECAVFGVMTRRDEATIRNEKGKEFACIENLDTQIGRVLEALEQSGELDNTYIVYTADHGIAVGKHAFMGKQNLYQHTFKVPMIVVGPDVPKNKRREGNVYLMDLLPTFCDMAQIEAPEVFDGVSFKPVVEGDQRVVRETMYGVYSGGTTPGIRSVVHGDWKLIKYDVLDGAVQQTQLFNLRENPNELLDEHHDPELIKLLGNKPKANQRNLAYDPKYSQKLEEMEAILLEQMRTQGDPYRLWNQPTK